MKSNPKLSRTIAAILSASAFSMGAVQAAAPADSGDSSSAPDGIQEITVTAQRRTENQQNVPITIQAITGDTLKQLNVSTFDDVVKLLPNVTFGTNGPGMGNIFMAASVLDPPATSRAPPSRRFPTLRCISMTSPCSSPVATSMSISPTWSA